MATPKAKLYASSLDSCRRLDLFSSKSPTDAKGNVATGGSSVNGQDWPELIRKFRKHCSGREIVAVAAATEHAIIALLIKAALANGYAADSVPAMTGSDTSKPKLGYPPLVLKVDRPEAENLITVLEASIRSGSGSAVDKNSAKIVRCWALYSVGAVKDALLGLDGVDMSPLGAGQAESYDQVLRVIAHSIEGLCHERLDNVEDAAQSYSTAVKQYEDLVSSSKVSNPRLDKIAEESLFRLCFWSKQSSTSLAPFPSHRLYLRMSARLSLLFRPNKALQVHKSFRALLLQSDSAQSSPGEWRKEVEDINLSQEKIIRATTTLPRAGSVNEPYLEFLDSVVECWRYGGSGRDGADQVVTILNNALTHTFQSPRLLRHLIRCLTAQSSYSQAGKALGLYVELFNKARETDSGQVAKDLRKFRANGNGTVEIEDGEKVEIEDTEANDVDSDRDFIETALFGSRLSCKFLNDPTTGVSMAKRAKEIFDEDKEDGLAADVDVEARIERALGISLGAATAKDADLETRPKNHETALQHLAQSVALAPASWESHYALSYLLFELRQIVPAVEAAKKAVELNNKSLESWHLLGLLVGAQKEFPESLLVLETGVEECGRGGSSSDIDAEDEDKEADEALARNTKSNGVTSNGLNGYHHEEEDEIVTPVALSPSTPLPAIRFPVIVQETIPSASVDLPRDEIDVLLAQVQMRMTKNVVIEAMEGPESALLDQQGLMSFFTSSYAELAEQDATRYGKETKSAVASEAPSRSTTPLGRRMSFRSLRAESLAAEPVQSSARSRIMSFHSSYTTSVGNASNASLAVAGASPTPESNPRASRLLVSLWLLSAASFRRAGRLDECRGAIAEAEKVDADSPDVWAQYAQYCVKTGSPELARTCLTKGLSFSLDHAPSIILLSRLYLATAPSLPPMTTKITNPKLQNLKIPFAESLLDQLTRSHGWDSGEAWFELSRCYKETNRSSKERECLVWALQLEDTRSVRGLKDALERVL